MDLEGVRWQNSDMSSSEDAQDGWLGPCSAGSEEQFVVALRRLRERSGLTFKQIERLTAGGPLVLPASTLATALHRHTVPRPELVAALVRVCGGSPDTVSQWLALRESLVHPLGSGAEGPAPEDLTVAQELAGSEGEALGLSRTAEMTLPSRRTRPVMRRPSAGGLVVLLCVVSLAGAVGLFKLVTSSGDAARPDVVAGPADPSRDRSQLPQDARSVDGDLLKIGGLCLSEKGEHDPSGLVQLSSCGRSFPPRRLRPHGDLWRVTTVHPKFGPGCMGVVTGSTVSGAALSDDFCGQVQTDRFILQRVAGGFHLLPEHHNLCVGVTGKPRIGSPLSQLPCDDSAPGQLFTISAK